MRRQPLHESSGGTVMTRCPRQGAQISRCYHHLLPLSSPPSPPTSLPPSPPAPFSIDYHHQVRHSTRESNSFVITNTSRVNQGPHQQNPRKDSRVLFCRSDNYHPFKTSIIIGRPFELSNVLTQVGKLPVWNLLLLLLVLSLLTPPAMCKPWADEQPEKITFRSRICQPVSQSDLRRRLAPAFDDTKMAADMSDISSRGKGMDGYQSDGPAPGYGDVGERGGLQPDISSLVEAEEYLSPGETFLREEEMVYRGNGRVEEREEVDFGFDLDDERVEEEDDVGVEVNMENGEVDIEKKKVFSRRSWLPRKRIINSHTKGNRGMSSVYNDFESEEKDDSDREKHNSVSTSYKYMRRRRRRRSLGSGSASDSFRSQLEDTGRKAQKSYSRKSSRKNSSNNSKESSKKYKSLLPLRLGLSKKLRSSRKLRKQLKKEWRQQSRKLNGPPPPPWECTYKKKTVITQKNVFPRMYHDGECASDKCFYRLYRCEPVKYSVKFLQRDENHCNPLPTIGNTTVYEESWNIVTKYVTTGCSCASLIGKNRRKI